MHNKRKFYLSFILILAVIMSGTMYGEAYAATPKLVSTITEAFEEIESWLLKIATPAAAVAVGTGIFMRKFSFGDEERIRVGKRVVRGSLFSYAFILAIDLVLSAIQSLVG